MFDRIKKFFGARKAEMPEGVVLVDDAMRTIADVAATTALMQAALGGLDEKASAWTRDERATVMGYVDGHLTAVYSGDEQRIVLASVLASSIVLKGARSGEQVMMERDLFVDTEDKVFMKAAHCGFTDGMDMVKERRAGQLGLALLLRGE